MSVFIGAVKNELIQSLKQQIADGGQWGNEVADWFTLFRHKDRMYLIEIRGKNYFYKNIDSAAKRLAQLIKRGY